MNSSLHKNHYILKQRCIKKRFEKNERKKLQKLKNSCKKKIKSSPSLGF